MVLQLYRAPVIMREKGSVPELKGCLLCAGGQMLYNGTWDAAETYMAVAGYG